MAAAPTQPTPLLISSPCVLVVVTYPNDEPGQQPLGPYLAQLHRGHSVERIELARLDQVQTGAQLVGILGAAHRPTWLRRYSPGRRVIRSSPGAAGGRTVRLQPVAGDPVRSAPRPGSDAARTGPARAQGGRSGGRRVPHRLVAAVAGLDDRQLDGALRPAVTMLRVLSRQTEYDANLTRPQLQACVAACKSCGDECERHAQMHEHCRVCAEACRRCEQACNQLLAAMQ
jgi:hypothetical protein